MKTIPGASVAITVLNAASFVLVLLLCIATYRGCIWENICTWFTLFAAPQLNDENMDRKMSEKERKAVIANLKRLKRLR